MQKAGSLLGPVLKRLGISESVNLERIRADWDRIFSSPLSQHMSPSKLTEGELLLNADSPIWIQQLGFYRNDILKKLRPYGVKEIRFRVGRVSLKKQANRSKTGISKPLSDEDRTLITEVVSGVADPVLQEAVQKAIEKSLRTPRAPR